MDFFLLGLVSRCSLNTVYRLQQEGRASARRHPTHPTAIGGRRVAVQVRGGEAPPRLMKVTDKGARLLEHHWKDCIQDSPDVESILRCATLAILMGDFQYAYQYLLGVADELSECDYDRASKSASFRSRHSSPLDCYAFMRMQWASGEASVRRRSAAPDSQGGAGHETNLQTNFEGGRNEDTKRYASVMTAGRTRRTHNGGNTVDSPDSSIHPNPYLTFALDHIHTFQPIQSPPSICRHPCPANFLH